MGQTKEFFMELREYENIELTATKKAIIEKATEFSNKVIESGLISKEDDFTRTLKNATFWNTRLELLKEKLPIEKQSFYGVEVTPVNGRKMLQYQEDEVWTALNNDLKQREELLKIAQNQDVIDNSGNYVPKVSVKFSKDSINIKF
jgi:hypothetical protein